MTEPKFEPNKFIVINRKHIEEMHRCDKNINANFPESDIDAFKVVYEIATQKKLNHKYYVCNQDEPYAKEVLKVILEGERKKEALKNHGVYCEPVTKEMVCPKCESLLIGDKG